MNNHIHIIVKSDQLSLYIQRLTSVYAMWFNQKYQRTGYLFQDRFKSENIEDETYFLTCFRYILQNPVKAGICTRASSYKWSSYQSYFNDTKSFVCNAFIPHFFDTPKDFQEYLSVLQDEPCQDIEQLTPPTDEEIKLILNYKLNGKTLAGLTKKEQKQLLREVKNTTNAGLRQLARITNIGYNIIRRL